MGGRERSCLPLHGPVSYEPVQPYLPPVGVFFQSSPLLASAKGRGVGQGG